jgi:hypothetical protein
MKLRNTYILLASFFVGCHQACITPNEKKIAAIQKKTDDTYRNNWTTMHLNGPVNSIIQFSYQEEVADTTARPYSLREYYLFDTSGNMIERTIYNTDRFDSRNVYRYNKDNKITETHTYAEDGSFLFTTYNVFDAVGNLVEKGERHADGSITRKSTYKFNEQRNIVESESDGKVSKFDSKYDSEGTFIGGKITFDDGNQGRIEFKHDSVGNNVEEGRYLLNGFLIQKKEHVFDSLNLLIKTKITDKDNKVMILEYLHDSHGNFTESYERRTDRGERVKLWGVKYEYDAKGNWTRMITHDAEDKITGVAIRHIRYSNHVQ